jgi:hypothetical protein
MKQVHRAIRCVAASLFWVNALGVYHPALSPVLQHLAHTTRIEFASVSIIVALLMLSLLSLYGLKNMLLSAVYIYTFPFIVAWKTSKLIFISLRGLHLGVRTALPSPEDATDFADILPIWESIRANTTPPGSDKSNRATGPTPTGYSTRISAHNPTKLERMVDLTGIVLGRSTLLCGFLIVVSSIKFIVVAGLVTTCIGLIRVNIVFLINMLQVREITSYLQDNFMTWVDTAEHTARNNLGKKGTTRNPVTALLVWKFTLSVVTKAREFPEMLTVCILLLFLASYAWISSVFYFIYLGVAKLTLSRIDWPHWSDSFLFPILGRNVAHTPLLTGIVVTHWIEMAILMYAFWTFITGEIDRLRKGLRKYEALVDERIAKAQEEAAKL